MRVGELALGLAHAFVSEFGHTRRSEQGAGLFEHEVGVAGEHERLAGGLFTAGVGGVRGEAAVTRQAW